MKNIAVVLISFFFACTANAVWVPTIIKTGTQNRNVGDLIKPTTITPTAGVEGKQRVQCFFSHALQADPIVYPNQAMAGHFHDFFGNQQVTGMVDTVPELISLTSTSCKGGSFDYKSSYWMPSMVNTVNMEHMKPDGVLIYYSEQSNLASVQQIPKGLKMIIGNHMNTVPGLDRVADWSCAPINGSQARPGMSSLPTIPHCLVGERLRETISFKQCLKLDAQGQPILDTTQDSSLPQDHKSHLISKVPNNECPTGYMHIPKITLLRDWNITLLTTNTLDWRLSSDSSDLSIPGGVSSHADAFIWMSDRLGGMIVNNCIRAQKDCQIGVLGKDPADNINKLMTGK